MTNQNDSINRGGYYILDDTCGLVYIPDEWLYFIAEDRAETNGKSEKPDWKRFEPVGTTPVEPLKTYISVRDSKPEYPLNHAFECAQSCGFSVGVVFFLIKVLRILF